MPGGRRDREVRLPDLKRGVPGTTAPYRGPVVEPRFKSSTPAGSDGALEETRPCLAAAVILGTVQRYVRLPEELG